MYTCITSFSAVCSWKACSIVLNRVNEKSSLPRSGRFDSRSGHIPKLRVQSPVREHVWEATDPYSFFFLRFYSFVCRERKGGRKRGRETSMCGCTSMPPTGDLASNPGMCTRLGIEPAIFWFTGRHSIHWATPARADGYSLSFSLSLSPFSEHTHSQVKIKKEKEIICNWINKILKHVFSIWRLLCGKWMDRFYT